MIKKIFTIIMVVFLFTPTITVYADVVFGNEFLNEKKDKTEIIGDKYYGKSFYVNSPSGYISSKEAPDSNEEAYKYENGRIIRIYYIYKHKGKYWGSPPINHGSSPGWFPMDELLTYYDNGDFETEHKHELYDYTGGFHELSTSEEFYIWQWPGSDREKIHYFANEYSGLDNDHAIRAKHAYMDDNGCEWVYIVIWDGYSGGESRWGSAEGWVCLSDLNNGQIPAFNPAPPPAKWSRTNISVLPSDDDLENEFDITPIIIALVVALVGGTAVVIWIFLKKKKTKS